MPVGRKTGCAATGSSPACQWFVGGAGLKRPAMPPQFAGQAQDLRWDRPAEQIATQTTTMSIAKSLFPIKPHSFAALNLSKLKCISCVYYLTLIARDSKYKSAAGEVTLIRVSRSQFGGTGYGDLPGVRERSGHRRRRSGRGRSRLLSGMRHGFRGGSRRSARVEPRRGRNRRRRRQGRRRGRGVACSLRLVAALAALRPLVALHWF